MGRACCRSAGSSNGRPRSRVAATVAAGAVPVVELHKSTAPAVGTEHLGHEREEVVEPAIVQCAGNRRPAVALTEAFLLDVRVGDLFIAGCRVRISATTR